MLPLTEVCRTIRRDVRTISALPMQSREFDLPTISRKPSKAMDPPESFRQMRQRAAEDEEALAQEAIRAAAAAGGQAYLQTTYPSRSSPGGQQL